MFQRVHQNFLALRIFPAFSTGLKSDLTLIKSQFQVKQNFKELKKHGLVML